MASGMLRKKVRAVHLNPRKTLHGGNLMKWMDEAGGFVAYQHSDIVSMTVYEETNFSRAVKEGEWIVIQSAVHYVGTTSVHVGIDAYVEDKRTGELLPAANGFFIYVAVDGDDNKIAVPPFIPETDEEKENWRKAKERREN